MQLRSRGGEDNYLFANIFILSLSRSLGLRPFSLVRTILSLDPRLERI